MNAKFIHPFVFALSLVLLSSCTVELEDLTRESTYNAPINEQRFYAELTKKGTRVCKVDVHLNEGPGVEMIDDGNDRWIKNIPVTVCDQVVDYFFTVHYSTNTDGTTCASSKRFPETGTFRKTILGQPPECEQYANISSSVFTVNTFEDLADDNPGDGICRTDGDGSPCSLRAAIMEANAKSGTDKIIIPQGRYTLTRTKPSGIENDLTAEDSYGDLDITDDLLIEGQASHDIQMGDFLIGFRPGDLSTYGWDDYTDDPDRDAFFVKIDAGEIDRVMQIHHGGRERPIFVELKSLQLMNGRIIDRPGGGILNHGNLRTEKVVVLQNYLRVDNPNGGVFSRNRGAGIANHGIVNLQSSAILYNQIRFDSGIGGGLYNAESAVCKMEGCLISNNEARFGGGIYNMAAGEESFAAKLYMTNCTVSRNQLSGSPRGIIVNGGFAQLTYVTIAAHPGDDAISNTSTGRLWMAHCLLEQPIVCGGDITSLGGNWIDGYGSGCSFAARSDTLNKTISAGSMSYKGGFTPVHPFTSFDNRHKDKAPPVIFTATDQTGNPRFVDADGDGNAWPDPGAWEAPD